MPLASQSGRFGLYILAPNGCEKLKNCHNIFDITISHHTLSDTSNVTGHHQGPQRKLRICYRAPSLQSTSYFSSLSVISHPFSALCVYSKCGHHPHPLGYLCATFHFCCSLHCWASPWRKLRTHSLTHSAYSMSREPKLSLRKNCQTGNCQLIWQHILRLTNCWTNKLHSLYNTCL